MRNVEMAGSENKKKKEFPAKANEAEIRGPWFMLSGNLEYNAGIIFSFPTSLILFKTSMYSIKMIEVK